MKNNKTITRKVVFVIFLMLSSSSALATIMELQPGLIEAKDAQIVNDNGTKANSNYQSPYLITNWTNNYRSIGLIQFDLGDIPNDVEIVSASLSLFHHSNSSLNSQYDLFRVTSDWDELGVTFNTAPTHEAIASASMVISDISTRVFRSWDITSLVSGWISGAFENYGMWIEEAPIQGSATAQFFSSDNGPFGHSSQRPKLTIEYATVPEPNTLLLFMACFLGLTILNFSSAKKRKMIL